MRNIRSIFSVLLMVIFMIPAAGLYYTRHSCNSSGKVQYVLDQDYSCHSDETGHHCLMDQHAELSCCSSKEEAAESFRENEEECCTNEGNYLKTEEKYTPPHKSELPHIKIQSTFASLFFLPAETSNSLVEENAHSPPLIFSSKQVLLKKTVLLI